jgi:WD40 repeat protein
MLWDASETTMPVELPNHAAAVTGCAFSADGKWVLSAGGSTLYIRDAVSGVVLNCWVHPQKPGKKLLQDCAVSSDKHWIATTIEVSKPLNPYETWTHVCIWDAARGRRVHKLDSSKTLPIVHTTYNKPEKPTRHFILHCGGFHPDSKTLITVGGGNYYQNVVIWDAKSGQPLCTLAGYIKGQTVALRYSRDGRWIAAAYNASRKLGQMEYFGNVEVWDATTGAKSAAVSMETGEVRCCGFSPDSMRIVYGSDDGCLFLWNTGEEQPELMLQGHTGAVNFCGFTPDGRCIVSAGADRVIRVWNLEGEPVAALPFPQDVVTGDLHPTKVMFVLGDNTGFVHLFELM